MPCCPGCGTQPLTCADTGAAQQQWEALHPVEGAEVVDVLVQAIHAVLMLGQRHCEPGHCPAARVLPCLLPFIPWLLNPIVLRSLI